MTEAITAEQTEALRIEQAADEEAGNTHGFTSDQPPYGTPAYEAWLKE